MHIKKALAILSSAAIIAIASAPTTAFADKDRYDIGEEIGPFSLKSINSEQSGESYVSIDKYYGADAKTPKKAVLLSFFATYCEPCKREMPYLAALYDTYADKGLQVLLVSIDKDKDKIAEASALAAESGVKFPVLSDRFNIVAKRYFISKLPCVYIVDGSGKVTMVNVGYADDVSKKLLEEVRKLIGEPTSDPVPGALAQYMAHGDAAGAPQAAATDAGTADAAAGDASEAKPAAEADTGKKKKRKKKRRKGRKGRRRK